MAEYIDREKIFPNGVFYVSAENPESSLTELINRICNLPTADVVPKSEYNAVVSAVDNSTKEFLKLHDDYQEAKREADKWKQLFYDAKKVIGENSQRALEVTLEEIEKAKADVAREIFEEIESKKMFLKDCVGNMGAVVLFKDIAELKKKYTEDIE